MSVKPRFQTVLNTAAAKRDIFSEKQKLKDRMRKRNFKGRKQKPDLQSIPTQSRPNRITGRATTLLGHKPLGPLQRKKEVCLA
jgi:hypothetical protein